MSITRLAPGERFCRAVVHNGTVYLAGMTADDLSEGTPGQTRQVLAKIDEHLALAGAGKANILTATIWLRDIADFNQMNAEWDKWLDRANMPVRATVEARLATDGHRVEIMVIAAAG
jgi:enamine deaminase RidA (YjgF/YER057c/UK114 family)